MNIVMLLSLPFRYKPWRPRHLRLIVNDLLQPASNKPQSHHMHLAGAIDWLCRAQDVRKDLPDAGIAAGWSFADGWLPSYPETTGYIIETFLAAAKILDRPELILRAQRMIDWERSLQQQDGAFPGHFGETGSQPVIFNTGQIMHGMLAGYLQLGRNECLASAVQAGKWLVQQQDDDGSWRKFEHNGIPHVYNTRCTWALAATGLLANEPTLLRAARRNLEWALTRQTQSGWFANNAFTQEKLPFTHTIAYAIRGLLECGVLLEEDRYLSAALSAARCMAHVQHTDGDLAGTYADNWEPRASYSCLTGIAQMSINWMRLAQEADAPELREHALRAIEFLKRTQRLDDEDDAVKGGIAGSCPIWGAYSRFEYPNWAAKFFADALIMDMTDEIIPPVATRLVKPGGQYHG